MHRRLVSPLINLQSLNTYFPIFNEHIKSAVAGLPVAEEFFDMHPYLLNCTVAMFVDAALGSEIEPSAKQKYTQRFTE